MNLELINVKYLLKQAHEGKFQNTFLEKDDLLYCLLVIQILTESFSVKAGHSETIHCSYNILKTLPFLAYLFGMLILL